MTIKWCVILIVAGWLFSFSSHGLAANWVVSQGHPQASDYGPGTDERPWKTIGRAARTVAPGDLVTIHSGLYRERIVIEAGGTAEQPIRFESATGEHVVVTGADRLTNWRKLDASAGAGSVDWPYRFNTYAKTMTHPGDDRHRLIGRCEQVFIYGYPLRQVLSSNQLAPGSFFADVDNRQLTVWDNANRNLNQTYVEASTRSELLLVKGAYVSIKGLRFRYAANAAQHGAVVLAGRNGVLEDCVIEDTNASGASFTGEDLIVRRCVFRRNGQLGFGASRAHRLRLTDCLVEENNAKDFSRDWEAGGNKLVLCRDVIIDHCRFVRNHGSGLWFDIGNEHCTVRNCWIADNDDAGIFYEISYGLYAQDNAICGNGFADTPGAWGAQAGICLSSSPDCVIERNLIIGNREGFNFREQRRETPTIDNRAARAVWNHDNVIRHNIIARNRDAQICGWFDVDDRRHWPASLNQTMAGESKPAANPGDLAAEYGAKTDRGQPRDLTLEKLNLRFVNNLYYAAPLQAWFKWGPSWKPNKSYATLAQFQSELQIDAGSEVLETAFANVAAGDFRLTPAALASCKPCYPHGQIPGAQLGEMEPPQK